MNHRVFVKSDAEVLYILDACILKLRLSLSNFSNGAHDSLPGSWNSKRVQQGANGLVAPSKKNDIDDTSSSECISGLIK